MRITQHYINGSTLPSEIYYPNISQNFHFQNVSLTLKQSFLLEWDEDILPCGIPFPTFAMTLVSCEGSGRNGVAVGTVPCGGRGVSFGPPCNLESQPSFW